jgi:hypothetical protein
MRLRNPFLHFHRTAESAGYPALLIASMVYLALVVDPGRQRVTTAKHVDDRRAAQVMGCVMDCGRTSDTIGAAMLI